MTWCAGNIDFMIVSHQPVSSQKRYYILKFEAYLCSLNISHYIMLCEDGTGPLGETITYVLRIM